MPVAEEVTARELIAPNMTVPRVSAGRRFDWLFALDPDVVSASGPRTEQGGESSARPERRPGDRLLEKSDLHLSILGPWRKRRDVAALCPFLPVCWSITLVAVFWFVLIHSNGWAQR